MITRNSSADEADYITVVKDRLIMSAECRLPLLAKIDPPCSAVSAIAEVLLIYIVSQKSSPSPKTFFIIFT